jgi:hypothetical protein
MSQHALKLGLSLFCFVAAVTAAVAAPQIDNITPNTVNYGKGGAVNVGVHDAKPGMHLMIAPGGPTLGAGLKLSAAAHDIAVSDGVAVVAAGSAGIVVVDLGTFKITGRYHDGRDYTHVALQGEQVLASADSGRLIQVDIHDHAQPHLVHSLELGASITAMSWSGTHVYLLLGNDDLQDVELSGTAKPRALARRHLADPATALASDGDHVFLADGAQGLAIIDGGSGKVIGRYRTTGPALDVSVQQGLAFIAQGDNGMLILDVRNPMTPVWIGSHGKLGNVQQVRVQYDRALLSNERGQLALMDISRPEMPTTWAAYPLHGAVQALALQGHESLVAAGLELRKIDFSNQPPQISNEGLDVGRGVNFGGERRAYIDGNIAYVADWFSGIHLYDISHPEHLTLFSSFHTPGSSKGITVRDGIAYVADDDHGLQVVDVHDPLQPKLIANLPTPGLAYIPKLVGDTLYLAGHRGGLQIIDVHDPGKPRLITTVETPGMAWGIAVDGTTAYVADDQGGLLLIDVHDVEHAHLLGEFNPGGRAEDVLVRKGIAYVSFFDQGLYILDVHDPAAPKQLAHLLTPGNARGIAVHDDHLYLADWLAGVEVIDIHDPSQPRLVGSYDTPGAAWGVNVQGDHVYVSDWWGGFLALDVKDPQHPVLAGRYHERGQVEQIAARDNFLFAANGSGGLQIFDNRNPLNPTWVTGVDTNRPVERIMLNDDIAFLGEDNGTVSLVNVKNPFEAYDIGELELPATATAMAAKGGIAYFAVPKLGIVIADVSTPRWPKEIARYITPVADISLHGDTLYVLTPDSIVKRLDVSDPGHPVLRKQDVLSGDSSLLRVLGDELVIYQPQRGLLALRDASGGLLPTASYPFKGKVSDMTVAGGMLYATVQDDGVYTFSLDARDFHLQGYYPLLSRATRVTVHKGTVYLAGESAIVALAPLAGLTINEKGADQFSVSFPPYTPLGSYSLELSDADGDSNIAVNAIQVSMPQFSRPNITPEEFERLLKEQRAKNHTQAPSGQ